MSNFKKYTRTQIAQMRPVTDFEEEVYNNVGQLILMGDQEDVEVSIRQVDLANGSPKIGDMIARNPKNHKDQWLVAKQYFEDNFASVIDEPGSEFDFGTAIWMLKRGFKVARKGWNGKNMFLFLLPAGTIPKTAIHDPMLKKVLSQNGIDSFDALASIRMMTADQKILTGWRVSQTDMLADDWVLVE